MRGDTSITFNSIDFEVDITSVDFVMDGRVSASITNDDVYEFLSMNWHGPKGVYEDEGDLDYVFLGGIMSKEQIIKQIELWISQNMITFDDLQTLSGQAYAKEAAQDE